MNQQNRLEALRDREKELRAGYDLIAVVLGDGGHRREEIGARAAADEAIMRWSDMRSALDALLGVVEKLVDTERCSDDILRAMNDARRLLFQDA